MNTNQVDRAVSLFEPRTLPKISRARIAKGRWSRRVPWSNNGIWRSDMFKSVLNDPRLIEAEFVCVGGPRVIIPVEELRAVLPRLHDHYNMQIWGPFNLDPARSMIDGYQVQLTLQ
jgi:hypothetical protein